MNIVQTKLCYAWYVDLNHFQVPRVAINIFNQSILIN